MKYIILEVPGGIPLVLIFSANVAHKVMAAKFPNFTVISAGKYRTSESSVRCANGSDTLQIPFSSEQSDEDEVMIRRALAMS